ncbi:hypothetical protein D1AOALGA4SA_1551 [Olavius algarvensis Delta 1 endosymbiont]|nr:hypothetical protein D1AOALGA4SA_1551 [Olavius algarvensis Delta 1 endosymbiont]
MKDRAIYNSMGEDDQQSEDWDFGERESCNAGKSAAIIITPNLPASQLPSFKRLLL